MGIKDKYRQKAAGTPSENREKPEIIREAPFLERVRHGAPNLEPYKPHLPPPPREFRKADFLRVTAAVTNGGEELFAMWMALMRGELTWEETRYTKEGVPFKVQVVPSEKARLTALKEITDRFWGKIPEVVISQNQEESNPNVVDVEKLTPDELTQLLAITRRVLPPGSPTQPSPGASGGQDSAQPIGDGEEAPQAGETGA